MINGSHWLGVNFDTSLEGNAYRESSNRHGWVQLTAVNRPDLELPFKNPDCSPEWRTSSTQHIASLKQRFNDQIEAKEVPLTDFYSLLNDLRDLYCIFGENTGVPLGNSDLNWVHAAIFHLEKLLHVVEEADIDRIQKKVIRTVAKASDGVHWHRGVGTSLER